MLQRTAKGLLQIVAGLVAGLVIVALLCAWMLSRGPISLALVENHVTDFLHKAFPDVEIAFEDTILTWAGWDRAIDIRIVNLQMATIDGKQSLSAPQVSFALSTRALLHGVAAPSRLEIMGPAISVTRETQGAFNLAFASATALASGHLERFLKQLSVPARADDPLGYLKTISIEGADIIVEDKQHNQSWVTPDVQLMLMRDGTRIDGETSFLVDLGDTTADVSIVGNYDDATERIDAGISFGSVIPAVLADTSEHVKFLENFLLPLQGTVTISSSIDGVLDSVGFDVNGTTGSIHLPDPVNAPIGVQDIQIQGQYDANSKVLSVAGFTANLMENTTVEWPAPVDHSFLVNRIALSGSYGFDNDRLDISNLGLGLDEFEASLSGSIDQITSAPSGTIHVSIPAMTVRDVKAYWPESVLDDAQQWTSRNILSGHISDIGADIELRTDDQGALVANDVQGWFTLSDTDLKYVDEMPVVSGLDATVQFDMEQFLFDVSGGQSAGMNVTGGRVSLLDISTNVEHAEIKVSVEGGFDQAMTLIDREPFGFATEVGIDPYTVTGEANVDLHFAFPLLNDLEWTDVSVSAAANVEDVNIPGGLFGLDINDADLAVKADNDGMDVHGDILLSNFPGTLTWRQNFSADEKVQNRYVLAVEVTDVKDISDLGVDVRPFSADMVSGMVPLEINVTEFSNGTAHLEGTASLDFAELNAPAIDWKKQSGAPGTAKLSIDFVADEIASIPSFEIQTDDLQVTGRAAYSRPGGYLSRIELDHVRYGRTNLSGLMVPVGNGNWDGDFRGSSLDLSPVWEEILEDGLLPSGETLLKDVSISVQFDRVWLSEERGVSDLTGVMSRNNDVWRSIYLTSVLDGGDSLEIKLTPSETDNARILTVWSLDAGEVFRTLDVYEDMLGGELSLTGRFNDAIASQPLIGKMEVRDYRILRAPTLAQMLSILALTGILDALQGDGLGFDQLIMPFSYVDGILDVDDVRANGASLGFTASGKVYTQTDYVNINGTIVPAYVFNSLLGNIPLVGDLFSGGEEGGGLFAANYSMAGALDDPGISINPLSVLAPGFLRNIFSGERTGQEAGGSLDENSGTVSKNQQ